MVKQLRANYRRTLLSLLMLLMFAPAASKAVSYTLPDTTVDSPSLYLEVARTGDGNSLQAPQTFVKFAFNTSTSRVISIYDGAFCVPSNFDTQDPPTPPSCTSVSNLYDPVRKATVTPTQQIVDYTFFAFRNDKGQKIDAMTPGKTGFKYSIPMTSLQLAANGTTNIDVSSLATIPYDTDHKFFVIMQVQFRDQSATLGGVNAFKTSMKNKNGIVTYDSNDLAAPDYPLAIQRRPIDPRRTDSSTFQFTMGCEITNTQRLPLKWQDADAGNANQPEDITWTLHDDTANQTVKTLNSTANIADARGPTYLVNMGGSGQSRSFYVDFKPHHNYTWKWTNVNSYNGLQLYLPFDSYNYNRGCTDYTAVATDESGTSGAALPFNVDTTLSTIDTALPAKSPKFITRKLATNTTAVFTDVENGFGWKVAPSFNDPTDPKTNGWVLDGYVVCDSTTAAQTGCKTTNKANIVHSSAWQYNLSSGHDYKIQFYYIKGSAVCSSITASPTALSPSQNVTVNMAFKNSGGASWSTAAGYNAKQGTSTPPPVIGPATVALPAGTFANGSTATFAAFTFAAPATPGTYAITYYMALNGNVLESPCSTTVTVKLPAPVHKFFGANLISILQKYVRDNAIFPFKIGAYFWPDAGTIGPGFSTNLWLSGIWDDKGGAPDTSKNAEINNISTINTAAEAGCPGPGSCLQRVPLAYVPQDDGKGVAATATTDGSTTPNGNNWLSLKNRTFGSWDLYLGGIASTDTTSVGGYSGNHLKNVEMSNIHVALDNVTHSLTDTATYGTPYQGVVPATSLQPSDAGNNLPTGSQGPGGPGLWDNVRNPNKVNANYGLSLLAGTIDFPNTGGSPANFTADPNTVASAAGSAQDVSSIGQATTVLQDGQGSGYPNQSEPFTLTGSVKSADTTLKWDEYIDWSQVDDKGHWRVVKSGGVATGFEFGAYTSPHNETLHYYSGGSGGSPVYINTTYYYSCYNSTTGVTTYGSSTSGAPSGCSTYYSQANYDYSSTCQSTGPTYAYNNTGSAAWSTPNNESKFGWLNTQSSLVGTLPKGSNGQTVSSYFPGPNGATNPSWSDTGTTPYWQDTAVTAMSNQGSTAKPSHTNRWIYDTSDPLYTNQVIFDGYNSTSYYNGYTVGGSTSFCYYTASGSGGSPATDNSYSQYIDGYYANSRTLYENSSAPTTTYYGLYGASATFDGSTDGTVNTGWTWVSNKQRVRYEQTYPGHSRKMGTRILSDPSANLDCTSAAANQDAYFLGESSAKCLLPGRDSGSIYNPTISISNSDVFGTAGIGGYFSGNNASSAFLFSNGFISGFSSSGNFPGYFNNPSKKANVLYDPAGGIAAINKVFGNTFTSTPSTGIGPNMSGSVALNGAVYRTTGDLTIGATTFGAGQGTVYVNGNLHITGNNGYAAGSATDKTQLPSVGFVVTGNIIVDPNVTNIVGTYFAGGTFNTRSVLKNYTDLFDTSGDYNDDRVTSDQGFTLNGVMISLDFSLQRQLDGVANANLFGPKSENFVYDGRIVVNPPIGFTDIQKYPASWNESVPYN